MYVGSVLELRLLLISVLSCPQSPGALYNKIPRQGMDKVNQN